MPPVLAYFFSFLSFLSVVSRRIGHEVGFAQMYEQCIITIEMLIFEVVKDRRQTSGKGVYVCGGWRGRMTSRIASSSDYCGRSA